MTLREMQAVYIKEASLLGDFQSMTLETLGEGYCKAVDTKDRKMISRYFSAIILRVWFKVSQLRTKNNDFGQLESDEYLHWVEDGINLAFKYRAWLNPEKHVNIWQCITQAIETSRQREIYQFNLQKHKARFNTLRLAPEFENEKDSLDFEGGASKDPTITHFYYATPKNSVDFVDDGVLDAKLNVQNFINKNKIIEAIIVDNIAFNSVEREVDGKMEFWNYMLTQELLHLPERYKEYFKKTYNVETNSLDEALQKLKGLNTQKVHTYISNTLQVLRNTTFKDMVEDY